MFTSVKGGLIAMVPSLLPIILVFGAMGLLHLPLNPGTAMVAVIAIGIAVDGTIHLLSRYNELCRRTSDFESAVKTTVQNVSVLRYDLERIRKDLEYFPGIVAKLNFNISAILGTRLAEHMKMLEGHSEDLGQVTPKGSS